MTSLKSLVKRTASERRTDIEKLAKLPYTELQKRLNDVHKKQSKLFHNYTISFIKCTKESKRLIQQQMSRELEIQEKDLTEAINRK
jgi:hypothetical protein